MSENMYSCYLDRGWSCFPIQYRGKRPLFSWAQYQEEHATAEEVDRWIADHPAANVAVATGAISGIIVVDIDSDEGKANLEQHGIMPRTPYQRTGKGEHWFFAYPGFHQGNKAAFVPGVDLRADGGYVVVAPSVHPSGAKYEWVVSPADCDLAPMPEWLVHLLKPKKREVNEFSGEFIGDGDASVWLDKALTRAVVGTRDETAFWLACQLRDNGVSYSEAENVLRDYAGRVPQGDSPYTDKEAMRKVRSAWSKAPRDPATSRQASQMDTSLYAEESWQDRAEQQAHPPPRDGEQQTSAIPLFVTTDDVYDNLVGELMEDPNSVPKYPPFEFPLKAVHHLGGFARYSWPAKMVYIVGGSGFLKTTFAEHLQDNLLKAGLDFAHFGPEWKPDEMGIRGLQRYDGVSLDEMAAHRVYMSDVAHDYETPRGQRLSQERRSKSLHVIGERQCWPGRGYYIEDAAVTFDKLIQSIVAAVEDSRARGRQFAMGFFDYGEIMRRFSVGGNNDAFWGERIATVIKNTSIIYGFTAVMLWQAKKGEADQVFDAGVDAVPVTEVLLGPASAQGVSNQQCNLYITLNPHFDDNRQLTGNMLLNVCKNSGGETGLVDIKFNPRLLQFMDKQ